MQLIALEAWRKAARDGLRPGAAVYRVGSGDPTLLDDKSRIVRFCFSDGSVDRMGDTIDPNGWDLADFNANPVALWAHDSTSPPIGRASNVAVEGARLMGDIEFADVETYAFADTVFRLLIGKFLQAVSVGFLPTKYSFVDNDPNRGFGIDFEKQQLLEISVCPVPANPNALSEARSKGIDTRPLVEWAERTLAGDGRTLITRAELERLRKAAKEPSMTRRTPAKPRADDDKPDDDAPGKATCGRKAADECGLTDPSECAIHGKAAADPDEGDDEKRLRRLLKRILRKDGAPDDDEPPLAGHDAVLIAHKCLRTAKAFMTEGMAHHAKGMGLLDGVVDSLKEDGSPDPDDKSEGDTGDDDGDKPDPDEKAKQLARAAALRARIAA